MNEGHTWFTCCITPTAPAKPFNFGFAAPPAYNGTVTAPLHVDTFSLLKTSKVQDAAFKALTAMVASPELLTIYGAMPADPAKQDAWTKSIDKNFPGIKLDWDVVKAAIWPIRTSPTTRPACRTTARPRPPSRPSRTRSARQPGWTWTLSSPS